MTDQMIDEQLQELIRSSNNAGDVQEFASRAGLELTDAELKAATALVGFRAAGLANEVSANRRAAFLGRVAQQRTRGAEARRPGNPWIRRMALAAVAVAALVVAAAVGANAERVSEAVGEAVGLRDDKNVYHTTSFEPAFSVTLPNSPSVAVAVDKSDAFVPGRSWSDFSGHRVISGPFLFGIYKPLGWAPVDEAPSRGGWAPVDEGPSPARGFRYPGGFRYIIPSDIIAWLQAHPCLDAGEPQPAVDIGGVETTQIDAAWTCPSSGSDDRRKTLFYLEDPVDLGPDSSALYRRLLPVNISTGLRYRFWVLEVQGEDLVIVAPVAGLDAPAWWQLFVPSDFERVVQPMLDSLTFD